MDTCEEEIRFEVDGSPSLMVVRKRLDEIDVSIFTCHYNDAYYTFKL